MIFMDAFLRPSADTDATGVPSRLKTLAFLGRLKEALSPGGTVAFNINAHEHVGDDVRLIAAAFGDAAVYRCPPAENTIVVAAAGRMATDDDMRTRVGPLDARFGGALSFSDLLSNRQ
jgi:spermidine synthase